MKIVTSLSQANAGKPSSSTPEKAGRWYQQLAEGGREVMPFAETFWSPGYGALVDRFGVPWMVNTIPPDCPTPQQG